MWASGMRRATSVLPFAERVRELRRRLASDCRVEATARWFIECMARTPRPELTPFELKFWKRIAAAFFNEADSGLLY